MNGCEASLVSWGAGILFNMTVITVMSFLGLMLIRVETQDRGIGDLGAAYLYSQRWPGSECGSACHPGAARVTVEGDLGGYSVYRHPAD